MIVVTHFDADDEAFTEQLAEVLRVLSPRPGFVRGSGGRSTDDDAHWVLVTEWDTVGSYRRALGNYDVKLYATTILARAEDRPSAFEQLVGVDDSGRAWRQRSDRGHADGPGRAGAEDRSAATDDEQDLGIAPVTTLDDHSAVDAAPDIDQSALDSEPGFERAGLEPDDDVGRNSNGVDRTWWRRAAVTTWLLALGYRIATDGVPIDRLSLILWTISGLCAASIGRRALWTVFLDWLPFAAILIAYDFTRGAATLLHRPTVWHPQLELEKWLFGGTEPTVWLQSTLKEPYAPWWEVIVSFTYMSYFVLPYIVAGATWIRNRRQWRRFAVRFVAINLIGLACFVIVPSAPPWAAASCQPSEVAGNPSAPQCMVWMHRLHDNGLLGALTVHHDGASQYVERIATRGFQAHGGLRIAADLVDEGQSQVNEVAAMPSLHAALSMLLAVFLWPLIKRRWLRPLLLIYPLVMAFSLVYSAEHYVVDILAGWALTAVVCTVIGRWEGRRERRRRRSQAETAPPGTDTLNGWPSPIPSTAKP